MHVNFTCSTSFEQKSFESTRVSGGGFYLNSHCQGRGSVQSERVRNPLRQGQAEDHTGQASAELGGRRRSRSLPPAGKRGEGREHDSSSSSSGNGGRPRTS